MNAMENSIRSATRADSPAVRSVITQVLAEFNRTIDTSGKDADLLDVESSYLRRGGTFYVVTTATGEVAGGAGLLPITPGETAELRRMFLLPHARGQGLGKRLLAMILNDARRLGFRRVRLETSSAMHNARQLYTSFGFNLAPIDNPTYRCDVGMALNL